MSRTNEQWLRDLRSRGADQESAVAELRSYLLRAVPGGLKSYGGAPADLLEDVVQETLIRVLDHLDGFEGRSRFTTWVTSIAVRVAMTELRRRHWKDASLEDVAADCDAIPEAFVERPADPESRSAQSEMIRTLEEMLQQLSRRQRVAIVAELRGMPQAEIGRRLGMNRNAVYKLGHDARMKLKRGFEAAGFDAAEIRAAFS